MHLAELESGDSIAVKILICSLPFAPTIGGIQTITAVLAAEFTRVGHDVCVVTETPRGDSEDDFPYRVLRCVSPATLLREIQWCDVYFQNSMSLRNAWPLLLMPRPWIIAHQTWIAEAGHKSTKSRIKLAVARAATSISISAAIANHLGYPSIIIGNPYDEALFCILPEVERKQDLVFVGNLGSVKGVDVLLRAVKKLWDRGIRVHLNVVGGGPEEDALDALTQELGLSQAVTFLGPLCGESLVREYNRHSLQIVPSRWAEPFGIVALEGIACGCVPIVTANGGLVDAIGPCGMTVPNGDVEALADRIESALKSEDLSVYRAAAPDHLKRHQAKQVAVAYLRVFQLAMEKRGNRSKGPLVDREQNR